MCTSAMREKPTVDLQNENKYNETIIMWFCNQKTSFKSSILIYKNKKIIK